MIVQEISSIYSCWRAGEISQEDALFQIGDSLDKRPSAPLHAAKLPPEYVHRLNIEHFGRLLLSETDPATRRMIERLLADEKAKD